MLRPIGVRDGGGGGQGGRCPPQFGQFVDMNSGRVDIIRAKHNTCLNNTNLGSVTAVNGKYYATPQNMDPGKLVLLPPPPTESIRAKLGLPPPKWMLARTPMLRPNHGTLRLPNDDDDDDLTLPMPVVIIFLALASL